MGLSRNNIIPEIQIFDLYVKWLFLTFLPECNTNDDCTYKNKNVCSNYKCVCNPGHVKDVLNNCQPCGENRIPIDGKCVDCPAGKIRAEDKKSCQSMSPLGWGGFKFENWWMWPNYIYGFVY